MITIIAAIAENGAIGLDNKLLYWLPDDMRRFRQLTTGHTVIMGRHTWESLPKGALPNRRNIVLTRQNDYVAAGAEVFASLDEALATCRDDDAYVIGGASIYGQAMAHADRLCITRVHDTPTDADAFFPAIDDAEWHVAHEQRHEADERHAQAFTFIDYERHPLALFRYCPRCGSPRFAVNNGKSKRCDDCGFTYYFNPSAATVALIERQGTDGPEWLCVRRAKDPARGTLDLPGGFSDMYETSEQGVCREVKEETGLDVADVEFLFSMPNPYVYSGFTVHTIDMFYRCRVADTRTARAADDASEILWLRPADIDPDAFGLDSIRRGIRRLLGR